MNERYRQIVFVGVGCVLILFIGLAIGSCYRGGVLRDAITIERAKSGTEHSQELNRTIQERIDSGKKRTEEIERATTTASQHQQEASRGIDRSISSIERAEEAIERSQQILKQIESQKLP